MPRKILLVDDDRMRLRFVTAHFKNFIGEHYDLEWVATYEDGLQKLLTGSHAACLLDYQLGERDGL
jgi:DNA-binding response OmpR family regulator